MLPESFACDLVSWDESYNLARILAEKIKQSGFQPDLIIAIGRGGYIPARLVSDFLLHEMLTSIKIEHWGEAARKKEQVLIRFPLAVDVRDQTVLIVDDVTDTGDTLRTATEYVNRSGPAEIRTGVLQHKYTSTYEPDYFSEFISEWKWIIYPWAVHEDLVGFCERVLNRKAQFFSEIKGRLAERFNIRVNDEDLFAALEDLIAMGRVVKVGSVYRLENR
jgi:hypoxanthine phosphoribosyltransferase